MAITNYERVGKALNLLRDGLRPFVERELKSQYQQGWFDEMKTALPPQQLSLVGTETDPLGDIATVLAVIWNQWNTVFRKTLGQAERTLVSELRNVRNRGRTRHLSVLMMLTVFSTAPRACLRLFPHPRPMMSKK